VTAADDHAAGRHARDSVDPTADRSGGADDPTSAPPEEPADLRLVLPATAVWAGTFFATGRGPWWLVPPTLAAVVVALLVTRRRRPGPAPGGRAALPAAVVVVALCLGGGLVVGHLHRAKVRPGDVGDLALERAWAAAWLTVTGDPRRARSSAPGPDGSDPTYVVPARLERVEARGRSLRLRAPVLVLARGRAWSMLLPGQRVRTSGRLGPARPGQPVAAVLSVRGPPGLEGRPSAVQRAAGSLRAGLRAASDGLPRDERGLLPGLVLGDVSRVPNDLEADFRTAGLTHLTAVSGANLAIVTGFVLLVGRQVGVRGRALPVLAAVAMAGFVVLARPQPSVVRAAAMGLVGLAALASGRPRRSVSALGATVVVLLLVDPWLSRSYGFALSVLATGGLVLLAPGWARHWQRRGVPGPLAQALAVPLAAQLACAPVIVLLSGQVSLVALPANMLAAPAVAPATVLGVLATVASAAHEPTAQALAWAGGLFVWWVVAVAHRAADLPAAAFGWPDSVGGALLLAAVTVAAVLTARRLSRRPAVAAGAAAVALAALVVPASRPGWPPPDWVLAVCDVGQGDALVLAAGPGHGVVVDAGPEPRAVDRCLRGMGVHRVPVVVLTHLHADHVEGLPGVLRGRAVGEVQLGGHDEPAAELHRVLRWSRAADVPVTRAAVGDRVRVGLLTWTVLWPVRVVHAGSVPNNASTVLLVRSGGVSLLLTGDVEPEAQRAMLATGAVGPVDVLKVAHHGSAHQAPELLAAVRPRVAVVSAGADNDYGHPAPTTLRDLRRTGAVVARTDRQGTVVVAGTGHSLRVVTGPR
jgi:competence protein ComEC